MNVTEDLEVTYLKFSPLDFSPTVTTSTITTTISTKQETPCMFVLIFLLFLGDDCSQVADQGYWEVLHPKDIQPEGYASHCAVVWKDSLYIVGGESYHRAKMLYTYDFNGKTPYLV